MSGVNGSNRFARVERLEQRRRPRCPQCGNAPFRVAYIDEATDRVVSANFPEDGCPGCGRAIVKELHLVIDADELPDGAELN